MTVSSISLPVTVGILFLAISTMATPDVLDSPLQRYQRYNLPASASRSPFAKLLASRASVLSTGHFPLSATELGRPKRALFDDSCKGVYDRDLFAKLDRVCDDCYNLYRKTSVSYGCRNDCYNNPVFENCLYDLMLHNMVDKYAEMVQIVGKK